VGETVRRGRAQRTPVHDPDAPRSARVVRSGRPRVVRGVAVRVDGRWVEGTRHVRHGRGWRALDAPLEGGAP
jgi:hypothetical protein